MKHKPQTVEMRKIFAHARHRGAGRPAQLHREGRTGDAVMNVSAWIERNLETYSCLDDPDYGQENE
jgi:hypothetical protein